MRLVDHDQVEMAGAKAALAVGGFVDQPHHRRIGRDIDAPGRVFLGDEIDRRGRRQKSLEGVDRLVHQRDAIRKKEDPPRPIGAHQEIAQRNHRSRLARACRHDEQRAAQMVLLKGLGDATDGARLVETLDNLGVDVDRAQRLQGRAAADRKLQLVLAEESRDGARRIARVVPKPMLVAVGIEDDRPLAEFGFEAVGVKLRLLLSDARVAPGALRLDNAERLAVVAPKDIVDEAFARGGRHALDRIFRVMARLDEGPADFRQQEIDEGVARGRFIVIVRVRRPGVGRLGGDDLRLQRLDFGVELLALGLRGAALLFRLLARFDSVPKATCDLLQLG